MPDVRLTLPKNTTILEFSDSDKWTVQDSLEGTMIMGVTGSGKTSGSGTALANRLLRLGYGGLVLTVKNDDRQMWADPNDGLCARAGRLKDLVILEKGGPHEFDFLEYELQRSGPGAGETAELARLFSTVLEAVNPGASHQDPYWALALSQLLKNSIEMAKFATGCVSLEVLSTIIREAPLSIEETYGEDWQALVRAAERAVKSKVGQRDLGLTLNYFNHEFPHLNDRTRSCIVSMFTSMADVLLRGMIGSLFSSGKFTLTPELSQAGKIILIDIPVKEHGETGRIAQLVFKYVWQKAAERRDKSQPMRPMFLWCDESHEFITSYDVPFQLTARSSAVATVYLTQNLRYYHARLGGGAKAEAETDSLLGNLNTKILHANGDPTTNQWFERLFGYAIRERRGGSISNRDMATSLSWNEAMEPVVPARDFTMLRKGSEDNEGMVEAIVFQTGRRWRATRDNYVKAAFRQ